MSKHTPGPFSLAAYRAHFEAWHAQEFPASADADKELRWQGYMAAMPSTAERAALAKVDA
jgi:hypothetical protein